MDNSIDQKALALAKAIRRTETGGHKDPYNARGASGEFGAFQFMPTTYKNLAQKHLGDANAAPTVENQNKIVYSEVKSLKDQGYNPAQIASIWNSGKPDKYKAGGVGVNKYGVAYNVPQYVAKVSQNYKKLIGTVQPAQQQTPEQPVEPTIEQQKQERIAQGLPVSVREDRAEPTLGGSILREIVKMPLKAGLSVARPITAYSKGLSIDSKYLGNVADYGTEIEKDTQQLAQRYKQGDISLGRAALGGIGAGAKQAMDLASVVPVGQVSAVAKGGIAAKTAIPALKTAARESLIRGGAVSAGYDISGQLASGDRYKPMQTVGAAALGTALDFGLTKALPEGVGIGKGINKYATRNLPENISSNVDKDIANIFKGTTGDIEKIRTSAFKARKGIELLQKEAPNIKIPDESAPLGSRVTKEFNPATAKPNELLSGVKELDNLIVDKMKKATEDARSRGFEVNTNDAKLIIQDAIDSGDVPEATAKRMLKQIDNIGNDPVKAHDWVQDVNMKYKKKYERGTIEDTAIGSLADDVAQTLRNNLDTIVDRKGYAEAYGNNQELKRMLVAVAKKANKQVNWGDITTDAGLDAAISILTGNPAYMARTVATSLFKNIWSKFRNSSGLRSFRNAVEGASKLPTETRLPYSVAKPQFKSNLALGEGKGFENKAGIQLPKPKVTTFEPKAQKIGEGYSNNLGNLKTKYNNTKTPIKKGIPTELPKAKTKSSDLSTEAKKYKSAEEFVKKRTESFIKKWTTYDNMLNKDGANLSTYDRLKNEITPEIYKELSKYRPKEPIELYRFQRKGTKIPILSSWSKDKEWITDMAELPNMELIKKTFTPDEILVDIEKIPSATGLTDIGEVIVKAKNYRNVSSVDAKSQLEDIWKKANKSPLPKAKVKSSDLSTEAKKYKSAEEFVDKSLMKHISEEQVLPKNTNDITFYHGTNLPNYNELKVPKFESGSMTRNYGDYFYVTPDRASTEMYGRYSAGFNIPKSKILSLEEYRKLPKPKPTDEQLFKKYWAIEMPDNEFIVKDVSKVRDYTKSQLTEIWNKANAGSKIDPLITEARKYKSAEEFVKAQGTPVYHGTTKEAADAIEKGGFKIMDKQRGGRYTGDGVYFTPEDYHASRFAGENGKVLKSYLNTKNFKTVYLPEDNIDWQPGSELVNEWKSKYDGVILKSRDTDTKTGKVVDEWVNEIVSFKPEQIKTKSQLEEIWKKANKNVEIEPLIQEAKKYKSAEDFINGLEYIKTFTTGKYGKSGLSPTEIGSWSIKNIIDKKMNNYSGDVGRKLFEKSKLKNLDSYTIQEFLESNKILGGLNGDMKNGYMVYRVVPEDGNINPGDFVFTNIKSAEDFLKNYGEKRNQIKIVSIIAKPDELILPVPEDVLLKQVQRLRPYDTHRVDEFIYAPKSIQGITEQKLKEIWNKANKSPLPKAKVKSSDLSTEAKKYKSAEEFVKAFTQDIKRGQYWHITEDPNFKIDVTKGPRDMSSIAGGEIEKGKLMITSDLPYWAENYKNSRAYVAKIDMSNVENKDFWQTERGMGNEFFVNNPTKARVEKVIPLQEALKESNKFKKWLEKNITSKSQLEEIWKKANKPELSKATKGKTGLPKNK